MGTSDTQVEEDGTHDGYEMPHTDGGTLTSQISSTDSASDQTVGLTYGGVSESDITRKIDVGRYMLDRPFRIRSACAESELAQPGDQEVKLNDVFIMDFVVYDSRSGITDKTNAQVAEGIKRLIGKNVQFRHIDPKENPYSLMGEVGKDYKILDKIDSKTLQPYMQVEFPLKLEVITQDHIDMVQTLMEIQASYTDEEDYESRIGCSLGWVETAERFLPYEVSITPYPRCNECRHVNQSGRLLSSTAEETDSKMKKDRTTSDEAECDCEDGETCSECKDSDKESKSKSAERKQRDSLAGSSAELGEREDVIVALNVENRELRNKVAEISDKLVENAKNHDKQLAAKEAELEEIRKEKEELETKVHLAETLPVRKEIAEDLMGLQAEDAEQKIEALSSMKAEDLLSYKEDLERVAQNRSSGNSSTEQPIIADASGTVPASSGGSTQSMTAEEEAKQYMAEVGIDIGPKEKPEMW